MIIYDDIFKLIFLGTYMGISVDQKKEDKRPFTKIGKGRWDIWNNQLTLIPK